MSVNWAWGRGERKGTCMKTGTEEIGKAVTVEAGRTGMVPSGCLVGNPEVPNHPNMSRWVAA